MEKISTLFGHKVAPPKKTRQTERGELLEYFLLQARKEWDEKYGKLTMSRIAYRLTGIPTKDLYALKSKTDDAQRRGSSWAKTFWWEIKPREELPAIETK